MNKAIIMEVTSRHCIVMTPSGQFKKIAKNSAKGRIGDEIQLPRTSYWQKRSYLSAAIACMLVCFFIVSSFTGGWFTNGNTVAAYVSIDVNPSIELGINHKARVLEAIGINQAGKQLLETVGDLTGLQADEAAKKIFQSAMMTDLLRPYIEKGGGNVVISSTIVADDLDRFDEAAITEEMIAEIQEVFQSEDAGLKGTVAVTNLYTPKELREEARKHGVSAGKMAIKLLAIERGNKLEWDELQEKAIAQIAEELGGWDELVASEENLTKDHLRELYNLQMQQMVKKSNDVQKSNSDSTNVPNEQDPTSQSENSEPQLQSSNRNSDFGLPAFVWQSEPEELEKWVHAALDDLKIPKQGNGHGAADDHPGRGYGLIKQKLQELDNDRKQFDGDFRDEWKGREDVVTAGQDLTDKSEEGSEAASEDKRNNNRWNQWKKQADDNISEHDSDDFPRRHFDWYEKNKGDWNFPALIRNQSDENDSEREEKEKGEESDHKKRDSDRKKRESNEQSLRSDEKRNDENKPEKSEENRSWNREQSQRADQQRRQRDEDREWNREKSNWPHEKEREHPGRGGQKMGS